MLHVYCRISSLLAGILTAFMLYSINLKIMGDIPNISLLHESTLFSSGYKLLIIFGCAIFVWISLSYLLITDFGLALRSLGQNKRLASINGIRIPALTVVALILSNALVGLGGGLFCQHESFADISEGIGTIIIGLAAVMIGEKILPFRSIWVALFSCLAGSVCYRIIVAFSLHSEWLGLESSQLNLITGIIVILIMVSPQLKIRRRLVS
jgi:putative ABC transport system permease protein